MLIRDLEDETEAHECGESYEGSSIVLGATLPSNETHECVIDYDEIIIPEKKTIKLVLEYNVNEAVSCITLDLSSVDDEHGGFTRWAVLHHILRCYMAYGEEHDAVLHSLYYDTVRDVYTIGCDS
jgi:hypothetical protein